MFFRGCSVEVEGFFFSILHIEVGTNIDRVAASIYELCNQKTGTLSSMRLPRVVAIPAGMTKPAAPACMHAADQLINREAQPCLTGF